MAYDSISQMLFAPIDSDEHDDLRNYLCNFELLGRYGASQYFVSILTGANQFSLPPEEVDSAGLKMLDRLVPELREHLDLRRQWYEALRSLFEREYRQKYNSLGLTRKWIKEDEAICVLATHPKWSDEQVAEATPTAVKQLERFGWYGVLRRSLR